MPQDENFWNPYRWVTISHKPVEYDDLSYGHTMSGLSGRIWCELEALTPFIVGDGQGMFVKHRHNSRPYIPGTSLKGAIRSLAEVVGNLDIVARTFGYLDGGNVFAGLIRFRDAEITEELLPPNQWSKYEVAVGQPKPSHTAFYPGNNQRKFYHHHPGATQLRAPHAGITQTNPVQPAPPGTRFNFTVNFENLRSSELNLLLYCLMLEEQVTVTLSPAALGLDEAQKPVILKGPMRHKMGGAKPHGAGSVRIRITRMELRTDAMARYRGNDSIEIYKAKALTNELKIRTASFRSRTDQTMKELRTMLIYSLNDPRQPIHYPTYEWFRNGSNVGRQLKPTI